jgi:hypothetical protein
MLVNNISNKSFIPKLNVNSLSTKNFNVDNSGNIYGVSLYINNQLIDFSTYLTASYLTNYVNTSYLTSQLANYVLSTTLSSTLNQYATTNSLASYRLITDSWSRGDTTNEILIRVGNMGTNSDGSITTAKQYTDNATGGLSAGIGVNSAAIAGLVVSLASTNATVAGLVASVATLDGEVSTLQTKTMYQSTGTGLAGPFTAFINNVNVSNGVSNVISLSNSGTATMNTCSTDNVSSNSGTLNISTSGGNINIGGLASVIYIGGFPYSPFNVFSGFSQW